MTAINRLVNKPEPIGSDLIAIWDSQAGRTRNTSFQACSDFTGSNINPITDVSFSSPNFTFTFYDGSTKIINIT